MSIKHQVAINATDKKYLSISSLQTDYLNLGGSSGCGRNSEIANTVHKKFTFYGGANHSAEKNSKGSDSKSKKLVRLVIQTTNLLDFAVSRSISVASEILQLGGLKIHIYNIF